MSNTIKTNNRMYYMDWLRIVVVILVIPHHVALTFSHIGKGYIYTNEPVNSIYYFIQSDFLNLWFMRLLFFISGVSAYFALNKRSNVEYIKERINKLLLPSLFVLFFLGPLTAYIVLDRSSSFEGSFFEFYPIYFSNISEYLGWAHMWFCIYLFTFSILTISLFSYLKRKPIVIERINCFLFRKNNILFPMFIIVLLEMTLRPFYPGFQNLINDWANFFVYITFFLFGYIIGQSNQLLIKISMKINTFLIISLISSVVYIYMNYLYKELTDNRYILDVILGGLKGFSAYSWVMLLIGAGYRFFNKKNRFLGKLSRSSFGLYIFHYIIISVVNSYLLETRLNHYLIFIISVVLTYSLYFVFYKLFIKRLKPLRFICGLKN